MPDYTIPQLGWICSRCGTVLENYVYSCPRCEDEEQEDSTTHLDEEDER